MGFKEGDYMDLGFLVWFVLRDSVICSLLEIFCFKGLVLIKVVILFLLILC